MADKKKDKPAVKTPSAKKPKPAKPNEKKSPLGERTKANGIRIEDNYPGITEQINRFKEAALPSCPHCGSDNTTSVQVGIIGRTIAIAALTTKFKLVPNIEDRLGKYFCNKCKKFFD